jgi:hypothetical protein
VPGARTPLRQRSKALLRTMRRIHAERQLELLLQPMPKKAWLFAAKSTTCRKCSATCSTTPASGPSSRVEVAPRRAKTAAC